MEEGRDGAGVDVYVCRTMLLLLYLYGYIYMCVYGGGMEEGRDGVDVYVCRTMLLLLYLYGYIHVCIWQGTNQSLVGFQYKSLDLS